MYGEADDNAAGGSIVLTLNKWNGLDHFRDPLPAGERSHCLHASLQNLVETFGYCSCFKVHSQRYWLLLGVLLV